MSNASTAKLTEVLARNFGTRFCAHHQGDALVTEGSFVIRKNSKRWVCFACQDKSRSRPNADVQHRLVQAQFGR